jgi:hypothetical protein
MYEIWCKMPRADPWSAWATPTMPSMDHAVDLEFDDFSLFRRTDLQSVRFGVSISDST